MTNFIDRYHICVVKHLRMEENLIGRAKHMKLIMQFGVGLEGVIPCCRTLSKKIK